MSSRGTSPIPVKINESIQFKPYHGQKFYYVMLNGRIGDMMYEEGWANIRLQVETGNCFATYESARYAGQVLPDKFIQIHRELNHEYKQGELFPDIANSPRMRLLKEGI